MARASCAAVIVGSSSYGYRTICLLPPSWAGTLIPHLSRPSLSFRAAPFHFRKPRLYEHRCTPPPAVLRSPARNPPATSSQSILLRSRARSPPAAASLLNKCSPSDTECYNHRGTSTTPCTCVGLVHGQGSRIKQIIQGSVSR